MTVKKLPPFDLKVGYEWMEPETVMGGEFAEGQYWLDEAKGPIAASSLLTTTRSSDIVLPDSAGVFQTFGNDTLPRTDRGLYANGQLPILNRSSGDFRVSPPANTGWNRSGLSSYENKVSIFEGSIACQLQASGAGSEAFTTQGNILGLSGSYIFDVIIERGTNTLSSFGVGRHAPSFAWVGLVQYNWNTNSIMTAAGTPISTRVTDLGVGPNGGALRRLSLEVNITEGTAWGLYIYASGSGTNTNSAIAHYGALYPGNIHSDAIFLSPVGSSGTLFASDIRTIPGERPNDNPSEILSNPGGPFTTTAEWGIQDSNVTISIEDGKLRTDFVGASNYVRTSFPTVPGWEYIVEVEFELGSNSTAMGAEIRNQDSGGGEVIVSPTYTDSGFTSVSFTAMSETTNLNVRTQKTNPAISYIKSASVKLANGMPEPFPEWETKGFDSKFGISHNITVDLLNSASSRVISSIGLDEWNKASLYIDSDNRIKAALTKLGPELRSTASVLTVGSPGTVATFSTNSGSGTFNRVDTSNNSGVQIPATAGKTYLIDITGHTNLSIRSDSLIGSEVTPLSTGRNKYVLTLPSGSHFYLSAKADSQSGTFSLHSIREITMPLILQSDPITVIGEYEVEFDANPGAYALRVSNGIAGDTSTSNEPLPDGISIMRIGSDIDGTNPYNGWIKNVQVLEVE